VPASEFALESAIVMFDTARPERPTGIRSNR